MFAAVHPPLGAELLVDELHEVVVLGVDHHDAAVPGRCSMASSMRPKSSRNGGRLGCGGRTSVVNTLKLGKPAWIASGIWSKTASGSAPQSVTWKV